MHARVELRMLPSLQQIELQNGDRLSLNEFMWRWEQIPDLKHAELIEGVVYLASPVSLPHGTYVALFIEWLGRYKFGVKSGLRTASDATLLLNGSAFQPDIALFRPSRGKSATKYLEELPDLVVEVSYSSRSYDLGTKLAAYRSAGVREYITVLLEEQRVEWRVLSGTRYRLLPMPKDQILRSPHLAGLWLDTQALFPPDEERLFAGVELGLKRSVEG